MKRRLAIIAIMGLSVLFAACGGGKGKTAGNENTGNEPSGTESLSEDSSDVSAADSVKSEEKTQSDAAESVPAQDNSISTDNVPSAVLQDFEEAAARVEELTGGSFTEKEVCYETYSYSDENGSFRWDGKGLEIMLKSDPSTGYFWTLEQFGGKLSFETTTDEYIQDEPVGTESEPMVGVGGTQKYYLTPKTRGGDAFVLDYSRQNSDGTRAPAVVYLLYAHADEGDEITFSIRSYTVTEQ